MEFLDWVRAKAQQFKDLGGRVLHNSIFQRLERYRESISTFVRDFYRAHEARYKEHAAEVENIRKEWKQASSSN
jgi:hypothetical protein